jgi:DNA-binding transcriptional regulator YdaS (Cro superfamily)
MDLQTYIRSAGLSQAEFAAKIGSHPVTVSKWCSGAMLPGLGNVRAIEAETGGRVTAADLRPDLAAMFGEVSHAPDHATQLAGGANDIPVATVPQRTPEQAP